MSALFEVEILGDRNALRNLDRLPSTVAAILAEKVHAWTEELYDLVMGNISQRLGEKSGRLSAAVEMEVYQEGAKTEGRVFIDGIPYALAQERGAVIPAHMIYPHDKILVFMAASGDKVFATRVFHPGAVIQGQHFMRDARREIAADISKGIKNAIVQGIRQRMRGEG